MRGSFKYALLSAVSLIAAGCASTDLGQRAVDHEVSDKSTPEAGMEFKSNKFEQEIKNSGQLIRDPALQNYLVNLTNDITGDYSGQLRVYPFEAPVFNAGILPNGAMVVYSGLMLRAENEAQLALVLGHEFGHYYERHALERRAAAENATWGSIFVQVATLGYGSILGQFAAVALFLDFNQAQELEADVIGLERLEANGYDAQDSINLWKNLNLEMAASTNKRVRKRSGQNAAIFATHPPTLERITALEEQVIGMKSSSKVEREKYRAIIRPYLQSWLEAELTRRDYGSLLFILDRMAQDNEDMGIIEYMRGRTYATRNDDGDTQKALAAYDQATQYRDVPAEAYKVMGDLYADMGETQKARTAFEGYLAKSPNAEDRELILYMLKSLGN